MSRGLGRRGIGAAAADGACLPSGYGLIAMLARRM